MNDQRQQLEHDIKSLDLKQNAIKILINSFYGAFGNKYFYFHDNEIAQSITLQGQDLIKFSIKAVNYYFREKWHLDTELHEKLGISGYKINKIEQDAAIYTDTDSVYSCLDWAIKSVEGLKLTPVQELEFCLAINRYRLKEYFNSAFVKYAAHFNTNNRQNFELENLSRAGIWTAKKKYVIKVSYVDNKAEKLLEKEKLVIKGLEAIQSSFPIWARNHLQNLYSYLLDEGYDLNLEEGLIPKFEVIKEEMMSLTDDEIAFNFSVRVYDEYVTSLNPLVMEKGMPIYGRAAAYHNHIVTKTNSQQYNLIRGGSKIKFYYTSPNEYDFDIFGYEPGFYPEFALPMDRDQQFFRLIVEPINKLLVAMKFPEISQKLARKVEVVKSRSRTKPDAEEVDIYPLYAVDSTTLDYMEIPENCQKYIGNDSIDVPKEFFPQYLSVISRFGLNTVIVPKPELKKYRDRIAKKLGIEVSDPFSVSDEDMAAYLSENGWCTVNDASKDWVPCKLLQSGKDYSKKILDTAAAYKKVVRANAKAAQTVEA